MAFCSDDTRNCYATRGFKFYLSLPIRLKFLLGGGGAEGAMLAKRLFCFARALPRNLKQTPPPKTPPRSLRVRSGEILFLNKALLVKFNKFGFKLDRKNSKTGPYCEIYRTIRHKILKFSASRVLARKLY